MGAAQHHRLHRLGKPRAQQLPQQRRHLRAFQLAPLHAFHQAGTRHGHRIPAVLSHQGLKFGQRQRYPCGHDQNFALARQQGSGFQGRFHADNGQLQLLPQLPGGNAGSRVARDDDGFAAQLNQPFHRLMHQPQHLLRGLVPIGRVGGIAVINIILIWQLAQGFAQYADSAQPAVQQADRTLIQGKPLRNSRRSAVHSLKIIPACAGFFKSVTFSCPSGCSMLRPVRRRR